MKKLLAVIVLSLFYSNISLAKVFISHRVDSCGPKKINFQNIKESENSSYFFINYDLDHDFVIFNDGYQFPSFEEKIYHHLHNQRGVTTSGDIKRDGEKYIFILNKEFHKPKSKITTSLEINFSSDTFKATTIFDNKSETIKGVCW